MPTAAAATTHLARTGYGQSLPQRAMLAAAGLAAKPWSAPAPHDQPLARVAALLVSISRNNGYEGRDPRVMPDTLTSGFVADLLGVDVGALARSLIDLQRRGLIKSGAGSTLWLRDIAALERLAD